MEMKGNKLRVSRVLRNKDIYIFGNEKERKEERRKERKKRHK